MEEKVVWVEGLLLTQQHLQQWELGMHNRLQRYYHLVAPDHWGLVELEIDRVALLNGRVRLKKCCAIFKSGCYVDYVMQHDEVLSRDLELAVGAKTRLFLGVAKNHGVTGVTGYAEPLAPVAWRGEYKNIADMYDTGRVVEVLIAKLNLCLLTEEEINTSYDILPIAQVKGVGGSELQLVEAFIPPVMHIRSSTYLCELVQYYIDQLEEKIRLVTAQQECHPKESAKYVLLKHTLHNLLGRFVLLQQNFNFHPCKLFILLISLCSKLSVFNSKVELKQLPNYEHSQLGEKILALHAIAQNLLNLIMPKGFVVVELEQEQEAEQLFAAKNIDAKLLSARLVVLELDFARAATEFNPEIVRQIKVGVCSRVKQLINAAIAGVNLQYITSNVDGLIKRDECEYFYLHQEGAFWQQIVEEQSVAVFLPQSCLGVVPRLIVLRIED